MKMDVKKTDIKKIKGGLFFCMFLTVILVTGVVLISGCTSGGDKEKPAQVYEKLPAASQPPVDNTNVSEEKPEEKNEEKPVYVDKNSFAYSLSLGSPEGYAVSYDTTLDSAMGSSGMTIYLSGLKLRVDYISSDKRGVVESSIFKAGIKTYACTKQVDEWTCVKFRDDIAPDLADISNLFENNPEKPVYEGTQNIAGIAARCYNLESGEKRYLYCVHPEAYLALLAEKYSSKEVEYRMTATKVDLSAPDDSFFELPAEIKEPEVHGLPEQENNITNNI
jgi:hypothetical protein